MYFTYYYVDTHGHPGLLRPFSSGYFGWERVRTRDITQFITHSVVYHFSFYVRPFNTGVRRVLTLCVQIVHYKKKK